MGPEEVPYVCIWETRDCLEVSVWQKMRRADMVHLGTSFSFKVP